MPMNDRIVHEIVRDDLPDFERFMAEMLRHLGPE